MNTSRLSLEIAIIERHLEWLRSQDTERPVTLKRIAIGDSTTVDEVERAHVVAVLEKSGNITAASAITGISRRQLHRKLRRWGVRNPRGWGRA